MYVWCFLPLPGLWLYSAVSGAPAPRAPLRLLPDAGPHPASQPGLASGPANGQALPPHPAFWVPRIPGTPRRASAHWLLALLHFIVAFLPGKVLSIDYVTYLCIYLEDALVRSELHLVLNKEDITQKMQESFTVHTNSSNKISNCFEVGILEQYIIFHSPSQSWQMSFQLAVEDGVSAREAAINLFHYKKVMVL